MARQWQPFREPFRKTLLRTGMIAILAGAAISRWWGGMARWPISTLVVFWFSFGGHWVELWFLNWLRPRIPAARGVQVAARIGTWFAGGVGLAFGAGLTARMLAGIEPRHWLAWWLGGFVLIGIEVVVHLVLWISGRPSFYDGRG
jgi:hypothetical protein